MMLTGLRGVRFSAALVAGLLATCGTSVADTIHLMDGNETVEGRVIEENDRGVVVAIPGGGEVRVARSRIRSIDRDGAPHASSQERTAAAIEAYAAAIALDAALQADKERPVCRKDALDPARVEEAVREAEKRLDGATLAEAAALLERLGAPRIPALLPAIERVVARASAAAASDAGRVRLERAAHGALAGYFNEKGGAATSALDAETRLLRAVEPSLRVEVVKRLASTRDPIAMLKIIDVAFGDPSAEVRAEAKSALVAAAGKDLGGAGAWHKWWGQRIGGTVRSALGPKEITLPIYPAGGS